MPCQELKDCPANPLNLRLELRVHSLCHTLDYSSTPS